MMENHIWVSIAVARPEDYFEELTPVEARSIEEAVVKVPVELDRGSTSS